MPGIDAGRWQMAAPVMMQLDAIRDWHAHVYYGEDRIERARRVCESAAARFTLTMGRMHERPVGPHPLWSCQLAFGTAKFAEVVAWLALNRDDLTVFIHPNTGDALGDHRDRAVWMGSIERLDLSALTEAG